MRTIYWLGWEAPDGIPDEEMLAKWPAAMKGWCTGGGEGYSTWVGMVCADSEEAAWAVVLSCYGSCADQIRDRDIAGVVNEPPRGGRFEGAAEFFDAQMALGAEEEDHG